MNNLLDFYIHAKQKENKIVLLFIITFQLDIT